MPSVQGSRSTTGRDGRGSRRARRKLRYRPCHGSGRACGRCLGLHRPPASACSKPGGLLLMSTLNRTLRSFALAIVGAEYVLRWLPRGTHDWEKFLTPKELARQVRRAGLEPGKAEGLFFDPLRWEWRSSRDTAVNYVLSARKRGVWAGPHVRGRTIGFSTGRLAERRDHDDEQARTAEEPAERAGSARPISNFRGAGSTARSEGQVAGAQSLALARPLHARAHERHQVLCGEGRDRRGHGREARWARSSKRETPPLKKGDFVVGALGWQEYGVAPAKAFRVIDTKAAPAQAYLGVIGMPGVTAWIGLLTIGEPKPGRDRRGLGGVWRRRLGRRTDRQAQGSACRRHRRRPREMPLRRRGAQVRRLRRLQVAELRPGSRGGHAERRRRLFRECGRCRPRSRVAPLQYFRPHAALRPRLAIQ